MLKRQTFWGVYFVYRIGKNKKIIIVYNSLELELGASKKSNKIDNSMSQIVSIGMPELMNTLNTYKYSFPRADEYS